MQTIFILSGKVHSGKTTGLLKWAAAMKNIDGVFQPVIEEKRFIYHVGSRSLKMLESNSDTNITSIGNYKFDNETFRWARNLLIESISKPLDWLIIDEIGPLELEGKGLEPAITEIIKRRTEFKGNILCVVRDSLLEKFIEHYKLEENYSIFKIEQEQNPI